MRFLPIILFAQGLFGQAMLPFPLAKPAPTGPTVIFLTASSGNWTVPANWNNSNNSIEAIGAGGGGNGGATSNKAGGGGGGEYAKVVNQTLTPGASIPYTTGVGGAGGSTGGSNGTDGGNTTFNTTTVIANGG